MAYTESEVNATSCLVLQTTELLYNYTDLSELLRIWISTIYEYLFGMGMWREELENWYSKSCKFDIRKTRESEIEKRKEVR